MTNLSTRASMSTLTSQAWLIFASVRLTSRKVAPLRSAPQNTAPARSPSNSSGMLPPVAAVPGKKLDADVLAGFAADAVVVGVEAKRVRRIDDESAIRDVPAVEVGTLRNANGGVGRHATGARRRRRSWRGRGWRCRCGNRRRGGCRWWHD